MPRASLLDYFRADSRPLKEPAVVWQRGYRKMRWSYGDLYGAAHRFAAGLHERAVEKGDRVLIWGENSGEWIAAFWGCVLHGAVAVPMDAIADPGFAARVARQAGARFAAVDRDMRRGELRCEIFVLEELSNDLGAGKVGIAPHSPLRTDPIEIVFTSGTTSEPRGVVLTHGNVLANVEPIEREFQKYRRYERFFHPLRFLDLLPLSHVFGQLLGIFLPQMMGATSIFLDSLNPAEVIRTVHDERATALITVPRLMESLRGQIERDLDHSRTRESFDRDFDAAEGEKFLKRAWRFRTIHRRFGQRFWAIVSGGAALPAKDERFWSRLGYAVIQGYGLTETTSLVSLNHPFQIGSGSIGKNLAGMEVKLSPDGEILVRGENVASGYWNQARTAPVVDAEGWFHTGDIGERDASGNLHFKGRLKNVIVTPEGLNVHPQDLEAELRKEPGVRDCVVIGLERDGNAEPCAVLLLRDADANSDTAEKAVQGANGRLAAFQQIRWWMVWPNPDFPRTPTQKPVLRAIQEAANAKFNGSRSALTGANGLANPVSELISRITHGEKAGDDALRQLTSVERVELLSAIEDRYQVDLSEAEFAKVNSAQALQRVVENPAERGLAMPYPRWPQSWPIRVLRAIVFNILQRPAMLLLGWPSIRDRKKIAELHGPVLIVSNHTEFLDPPYILEALPEHLRRRLAVAMDGELLTSMRRPPPEMNFLAALANRAAYWLVVSIYNVFPLPRRAGFRKSFAFAGDLIDRGWSVLIFPEGVLTRDGSIGPFRAGIGMLAAQLGVAVVPVRIQGMFELKVAGKVWARPGQIKVFFGDAVRFESSMSPETIARDLHARVSALGETGQVAVR